jgi:hypothetical protein
LGAHKLFQCPRALNDVGDEFQGTVAKGFVPSEEPIPKFFRLRILARSIVGFTVLAIWSVKVSKQITPWHDKIHNNQERGL